MTGWFPYTCWSGDTSEENSHMDQSWLRIPWIAENLISSTKGSDLLRQGSEPFQDVQNTRQPNCRIQVDLDTLVSVFGAEGEVANCALNNTPALLAITDPLPGRSNFQSTWRALIDENILTMMITSKSSATRIHILLCRCQILDITSYAKLRDWTSN